MPGVGNKIILFVSTNVTNQHKFPLKYNLKTYFSLSWILFFPQWVDEQHSGHPFFYLYIALLCPYVDT